VREREAQVLKEETRQVDPVKYEMFLHRLWAMGEEGRMTVQRVSASPIVAQGGECTCAFYDPPGTMVLSCSGHLRFAGATSLAVKKIIELFSENPGIRDGDQFFQNDPYVAGAHVYDRMLIKPIFHQGRLLAWVATGIHTADTGGVLRGAATQIYEEGVRLAGLKVVEGGYLREDSFRAIVDQCRDPGYVALDINSCVAANNVCARRYLQLVEKHGIEFVEAAGKKTIQDSEAMARAKLREMPDGTWLARHYGVAPDRKTGEALPFQVVCTMTKRGDELTLDLTGTSGEMSGTTMNSTLPCTVAQVSVALTATLFWDVPWSDGKLAPVKLIAPEGSIVNSRFPAATGGAPEVGQQLLPAICECVAKMLYAAGRYEDVAASLHARWYSGGPGAFYGGHGRHGIPVPQGIYDSHGAGFGAKPDQDGVNTAGRMHIPSGGISDVERTEMHYPIVYFTRNHCTDGGGCGKFAGGAGSYRIYMVYGSKDLSVDYKPYGGVPEGAFGLSGGYPSGTGGVRTLYKCPDVLTRLQAGDYPTTTDDLEASWGEAVVPKGAPSRIPLPEFSLVADFVSGGGGYGDPLERDPAKVARDIRDGLVSLYAATRCYGIALGPDGQTLDDRATQRRRQALRQERLAQGKRPSDKAPLVPRGQELPTRLRLNEHLEVAGHQGTAVVRCRCGHVFCNAHENYKEHALRRDRDLEELTGRRLPHGQPYLAVWQEYICPGCGTMLQVDVWCPSLGDGAPLWDTRLDLGTGHGPPHGKGD